MKRKRVWLLAGIPGSGKSTWVRKMIAERGGIHCSRDEIRFSLLKDGEDYFAHEDLVFSKWIEQINDALWSDEINVYVDATHLNDKSRNKVLKELDKNIDFIATLVIFDIPLKTCLERNEQRTGRAYVPPQVIRSMYACFEKNTQYGLDKVYVREENENDISNIRFAL